MKVAWKVNHYVSNPNRTPSQIKNRNGYWKRKGILFFADEKKAKKFCQDKWLSTDESAEGPFRVTYPDPEEIIQ